MVKKVTSNLLIPVSLSFLLIVPLIVISGNIEENENNLTLDLLGSSIHLLGKGQLDSVSDMAIGASGHIYVMGVTFSSNFPTTDGVYDETYNGNYDIFVQKRSRNGRNVIWSTFLGGSSDEDNDLLRYQGNIVLDKNENIIIAGTTESSDFPVKSKNNYTHNGNADGFVAKLSADGTTLEWSTFLGGSDNDRIHNVAIDLSGDVYVIGGTFSDDFPIKNGFDETFNGDLDAFVVKLSGEDSELLWSSYLGGTDLDLGYGIEIDELNGLYLMGKTKSTDFPVKSAFEETLQGKSDVFITKFVSDGSNISFSTYLGGQEHDEGMALAVDSVRDIYVTGSTSSADFPVSATAYNTTYSGGGTFNYPNEYGVWKNWPLGDSYLTKLAANGTSLKWSTYLGGTAPEISYAIELDDEFNVYTTGFTFSSDFPLKREYQNYSQAATGSIFISALNKTGSSLIWSTYLGINGEQVTSSLVFDNEASVLNFAGWTSSTKFPGLPEGEYVKGSKDGFVSRLYYGYSAPDPTTTTTSVSQSTTQSLMITTTSVNGSANLPDIFSLTVTLGLIVYISKRKRSNY
ncbi:MAG: SBBP repeat-containing protein [Candidatus Hodarchaeales archaeon]